MRGKHQRGLVERLLSATGRCGDLPSLADTVFAQTAASIPFTFGCFATTDPATGLITWSAKSRPLGVGDEEFAAVEYGRDDINSFAELGERQPPVGVLSIDAGRLSACRRYREFLQPRFGFSDELRLVMRSRGASWGALALYRGEGGPPFAAADARELAAASGHLAETIQRCLFSVGPTSRGVDGPSPHGPAVVIIDGDDRVTQLTPAGQWAIHELGGWDYGSLPTAFLAVAADARTRCGHPGTRAQGRSGKWFNLRAAPLDAASGRTDVVITVEPTPRTELSRLVMVARGLTPREEDVAMLVLQGANTRSIAAALHLSPHTVQDHLKSIFARLGVSSRREMIALLLVD